MIGAGPLMGRCTAGFDHQLHQEAMLTETTIEPGLQARASTFVAGLRGKRLGDYVAALAVRGLEVLGKFGLYLFAARRLGGHDSGLLFFCLTWVNLASAAARMGMERTLTRHIAAEIAVGRGRAAREALFAGLEWCAIGAIGWAAATAMLAQPVADHVFGQPELGWPLAISAILLIPQSLVVALGFALTGVKRGALGQLVYSSLPPVLALGLILAGVRRLDHVILGYAAAYAVTGLFAIEALMRDWRKLSDDDAMVPPGPPPPPLPNLWRTALPFLTVELVSVAMTSLPLLLLGAFAEPEEVGAFSVASRLSSLVWMIIVSIGGIAAPRFAEHYRRGEFDRLAAVNRLTRRLTSLVCLPPVLAMLAAPSFLLSLIGPSFQAGAAALVVMSVGQLINCLLPAQDVMLGMTGHGRTLRKISMAQLAVGVAVGVAVIPRLGGLGAGITTAMCMVLGAVASTLAARALVPESV
jgi:O-antigen/teichoic acid export membrane protein